MHDIKDNSIGLLQPSSKDLHDKIFKLSPPLTLGKKEKFWEILQIIAYNEFKLRNNKSWYYGRKNGLTNWNELSEATVTKLSIKSFFFQRHRNDDENESSPEVVDEHEGIEDDGDTVLRQID